MNSFQKVIEHIELFIKKYYTNQIIKGGILFLAVLLFSYLTVSTLEYVGRFSSEVRLTLLMTFVGVNLFLLIKFLLVPLFRLGKLGKRLSIVDASSMIGRIFPEVSDKLKNTLQLHDNREDISLNLELVNASIEQRAKNLSVIPFSSGIDLTENRRYLRYLLPVVLVMAIIGVANPQLFTDGTERIVYFNEEFEEEAPFEFVMESGDEVKEGENYRLKMKLVGEEIPKDLRIRSNTGTYNLKQESPVTFVHDFANLNSDLTFVCEANGFTSKEFSVKLLRKPVIESIGLTVVYPKHTNRKNERFDNTGDITVPEGSTIEWNIAAKNLTDLNVFFGDTSMFLKTSLSKKYNFKKQFFNSEEYLLTVSSEEIKNADSLTYNVGVVRDEYPTIRVEEEIDSTNNLKRFIEGTIGDDYGFRNLSAVVNVSGKDTSYKVVRPIGIKAGLTNQIFSFFIDLSTYDLGAGDRVEYSFVVTDNDELNGFKSTSSTKKIFAVPEMDELDNLVSEKDDQMKEDMDQALSEANQLKKKIKDIKSNMVNKPSLDWKDKRSLEDLLKMQLDLSNKIEQLQKDFEKNQVEKENFMEPSEELLEKQEQLEKLMEELMDDEMQALFEELQKLMEEMNKDELLENMEEMEKEMDSMEEELDRTLELFKQMELDQKLESLQEQLEQLAEKQDQLAEETEDKKSDMSQEELKKEQEKIDKAFEEAKKDMDEIMEKNEELDSPRDMEFDEEVKEQTEESLQDAQEQLEKEKNKKASESQKDASDGMKEMAQQASSMQMQQQQQQQAEDMDALRYLLENLVALSQDQEGLMDEFGETKTSDPYYLELNRKQLDIDRNTEMVNDSLVALSKRVFQLSSFINEELADLDYNLNKSLIYSEERNTSVLKQHQQYAMTGYNDLALMLSEVLNQMQQQAASQQSGGGSCSSPGGSGQGKPKSGQMSMQQMKDALKKQIGKMKGGQKPGGEDGKGQKGKNGQMPGGEGGSGKIPGLSPKEVAKMAAQQGQMRESLKKMKQELNKDGSGSGNGLNDIIEDLDQMEEDLLNGNMGTDYVRRQQDILTKLLEHEKAQRERGYSEERESQDGKKREEGNLIEFAEYNRKKNAEVEFLRSLPVELRVYYKTLVNEYFNSVNE